MSDILVKSVAGILVVSITIGALASLLVIAVRAANTRLGEHLLTTRAGNALLRLYPVRQLAHWLAYNRREETRRLPVELASADIRALGIDFAKMAQDKTYQEEAPTLAVEFVSADREVLQYAESYQ